MSLNKQYLNSTILHQSSKAVLSSDRFNNLLLIHAALITLFQQADRVPVIKCSDTVYVLTVVHVAVSFSPIQLNCPQIVLLCFSLPALK